MKDFPNHRKTNLFYGIQMENKFPQNVWKNMQLENYVVLLKNFIKQL